MPLHVRAGTAFRWRPTSLVGRAPDVVRVREDDGVHLAVLANGFECGFSVCWPPASRLMLDLFIEEWVGTSGPIEERLHAAFERSRHRFTARAPALITPEADFPDDLPSAVLLAVAVEGAAAHAMWIGGDVAVLARGFEAIGVTSPHTLVEQLRREHPESRDLGQVPNVLVRVIGPNAPDQDPPSYLVADLAAGDTIVLLSRAAFRGPCLPVGDAAFVAAAHASPSVLAERLAEVAFATTEAPYAAVAVLRVDDVDLGATIDRLIDEYEPDPRHGDWLRSWSRDHRALPVVFDMGGILGMRRDGSVVGVPWDEPAGATREEESGPAHLAAVIGASRKYADLATLAPRRPSHAQECSQCTLLSSDGRRGCPVCWHLGWSPPAPPSWFRSFVSGATRR